MPSNKVVVYAGTRNLYEDMVPAYRSLLANTDVDRVILLIEDDAFPYPMPDKVEAVNVSGQTFFSKDSPNYHSAWTYMSLMRLALPLMYPDLDRVLYLDVDTIVERDISELFELEFGGCYFAAVPEYAKSNDDRLYVNAGVLLLNMKKLRDGMAQELIDEANAAYHQYPDQDVINLMCKGYIYPLHGDFNATAFTRHSMEAKIIHFAGLPYWRNQTQVRRYSL